MTDTPADPVPAPPDLDPGTLASANFSRARKGFEPTEVRAMLGRAADALRAWQEREQRVSARLAELERRLEASQELDEQRITTVLGEETARIVAAAREAATEIRGNAEEQAARLVAETEAEATATARALTDEAGSLRDEAVRVRDEATAAAEAVRTEAQEHADQVRADASAEHDRLVAAAGSVLEERTAEAEAAAAGIREAAQIELDSARSEGERIRDEAREAASNELESARVEGRSMVDEARQLRRQMLQDLAERRRTARRQIEAARAARDRVVEALGVAGDRVAQVIGELSDSDEQARRAADDAAAAVDDELDAVVAELETGLSFGTTSLTESPLDPVSTPAVGVVASGGVEVIAAIDALADEVAGSVAEELDADEVEAEEVDDDVVDPASDLDPAPVPDGVPDGDDPSPGATVHDLFERIRAERGGPAEDLPDGDGVEVDEDAVDDGAEEGATVGARAHLTAVESAAAEVTVVEVTVVEETVIEETVVEEIVVDGAADDGELVVTTATVVETTAVETTAVEATAVETSSGSALDEVATATTVLDRRDELLGSVERSLTRSLKRLVSDEQNEVLDRLRRVRRGRPTLDELLPEGEDRATFTAGLRDDFAAAADAGVRFWNDEVAAAEGAGPAPEDGAGALDRGVLDRGVLDGGLERRVGELLDLRRAHVQRALDHAADQGAELSDLVDHVRAAYREWRSHSVPDLAGDLTAAGFALGEQAAAGPGALWCWEVDNGGLPCSDAEDNSLSGATACGEAFPTGDVIPPAHPGCRCILVPARR